MTTASLLPALVTQTGQVVDDPGNQRVVNLVVLGLVVLGMVVLAVAVWFWKTTRPDPELLAPLEEMGRRRFRQAVDDDARRHLLDAVRTPPTGGPAGEPEVEPAVLRSPEAEERSIDPLLPPPPPVR